MRSLLPDRARFRPSCGETEEGVSLLVASVVPLSIRRSISTKYT